MDVPQVGTRLAPRILDSNSASSTTDQHFGWHSGKSTFSPFCVEVKDSKESYKYDTFEALIT